MRMWCAVLAKMGKTMAEIEKEDVIFIVER